MERLRRTYFQAAAARGGFFAAAGLATPRIRDLRRSRAPIRPGHATPEGTPTWHRTDQALPLHRPRKSFRVKALRAEERQGRENRP